jgi:hypothetical protein
MTATFTRTPGTVGRSTITEAGTPRINLNRIGKAQKTISNVQEANRINNDRPRKRAVPIDRVKAAVTIDPAQEAPNIPAAASTELVVEAARRIWIARPRIDREATFPTSGSKTFSAADSIAAKEEDSVDSAAIALEVENSAAVIALAVEDSVAVAVLADLVAVLAGSGADGNN